MTDSHDERLRRIAQVYPHLVDDPDWAIVLADVGTVGAIIRDLITVGHVTGRSGPREVPDRVTGMQRLRELTGGDP